MTSKAHMGGGHSQNAGMDSTVTLSKAPYFENASSLGLYPAPIVIDIN